MPNSKFEVGDKVKVMRKSTRDEIRWNPLMNRAIGKTYTVLEISYRGDLKLDSKLDTCYNYNYPPLGVDKVTPKNQQLLFEFMR